AALPGCAVTADLAERDRQDAAVDGARGDRSQVDVGDAAAHALVTGAIGGSGVAGHAGEAQGHHPVIEDAAAGGAGSGVPRDLATADGRGAAVGDAAGPRHRAAVGRVAVHLAVVQDQDAAAHAAHAAGAARDAAAPLSRGVVI